MTSEAILNKDIIDMTIRINNEFPELVKFLDEMPVTVPDSGNPKVNIESLVRYRNSLYILIREYVTNQKIKNSKKILCKQKK